MLRAFFGILFEVFAAGVGLVGLVGRLFWILDDLCERIRVAGPGGWNVGDWPYLCRGVLMPAVMGLHCAFLVPAPVSLGSLVMGMTVLDTKIAVKED